MRGSARRLLAAICAGAATLETTWVQPAIRVEPDAQTAALYDDFFARFRELMVATRPLTHSLALWQRDLGRGTMSAALDPAGEKPAGDEGRGPS